MTSSDLVCFVVLCFTFRLLSFGICVPSATNKAVYRLMRIAYELKIHQLAASNGKKTMFHRNYKAKEEWTKNKCYEIGYIVDGGQVDLWVLNGNAVM